jgi:hypothetical protein
MYAYWVDGDRQFLVRALLNEGPMPPRIDEDAPTAAAKAAMTTAEVAGTY